MFLIYMDGELIERAFNYAALAEAISYWSQRGTVTWNQSANVFSLS